MAWCCGNGQRGFIWLLGSSTSGPSTGTKLLRPRNESCPAALDQRPGFTDIFWACDAEQRCELWRQTIPGRVKEVTSREESQNWCIQCQSSTVKADPAVWCIALQWKTLC
mmetsp:Transcript_57421/g.136488  ORF Transcript_57421/g.136488 Transcript_57421/m.136488 type:complete len:110 (-) Transcript_57421:2-331(-)